VLADALDALKGVKMPSKRWREAAVRLVTAVYRLYGARWDSEDEQVRKGRGFSMVQMAGWLGHTAVKTSRGQEIPPLGLETYQQTRKPNCEADRLVNLLCEAGILSDMKKFKVGRVLYPAGSVESAGVPAAATVDLLGQEEFIGA